MIVFQIVTLAFFTFRCLVFRFVFSFFIRLIFSMKVVVRDLLFFGLVFGFFIFRCLKLFILGLSVMMLMV